MACLLMRCFGVIVGVAGVEVLLARMGLAVGIVGVGRRGRAWPLDAPRFGLAAVWSFCIESDTTSACFLAAVWVVGLVAIGCSCW